MAPATLKHYRLVRPLGKGGMGEVYLADDTRLGRQVALKILPVHLASEPGDRERFEREARAIAALNHPNIVTIYSVEEEARIHFLTMEFVDGQALSARIPPQGFPVDELLRLSIPIAEAISAAHDKGIIHRDLKPGNVMLASDGRVKVLDFGLAKLTNVAVDAGDLPTQELTGEGRIVGTVAYMSPEQAEGKEVDHRTDIFSLGVLLYEMATGRRPFTGDTSVSVISSLMKDTPTSASELNPGLPPSVSRVIKTCLRKDPERRFQSAKDVRNELQTLREELDSGELQAPSATGTAHTRRSSPAAMIGSLAALAAVAAVAWMWLGRDRTAVAPTLAASYTQLTATAALELDPSLSPDGEWVAYASDASGNLDVFLQSVGGQNSINLTADSPEADLQPAFSPDGMRIAFRSNRAGGGIFVMGRTGESPRRLTTDGFNPAWSPDGSSIVYATQSTSLPTNRGSTSELWIVDAESGETRRLSEGDGMNPAWSPDGALIAFWGMPVNTPGAFGTAHRDIRVMPASGGDAVMVTDDAANDWQPTWSSDGRALYFASDRGGSMNLWRVEVDPASGRPVAEPRPLTAPTSYVAGISGSSDGTRIAYTSALYRSNVFRAPFDAGTGRAGPAEPVTTGNRYWVWDDISPNGRQLVLAQAFVGQEDIYVGEVTGGGLRQLTDDEFNDRNPRWSPDGSRIAFYSNRSGNYEIWTVAPDGGTLQQITNIAPEPALQPLWSPDGSRLMFTNYSNKTYFADPRQPWDSQTLEELPAVPQDKGFFFPQSWSSDGRRVAGSWRTGAVVYDLDRRAYDEIAPGASDPAWIGDDALVYIRGNELRLHNLRSNQSSTLLTFGDRENVSSVRISADRGFIYFIRGETEFDIWLAEFDRER